LIGDWTVASIRHSYDQNVNLLEYMVSTPNPADPESIQTAIGSLRQTIGRVSALFDQQCITVKTAVENELTLQIGRAKILELQKCLPRDFIKSGPGYARTLATAIHDPLAVRSIVPYNFDLEPISPIGIRNNYLESLKPHSLSDFSGEKDSISWGVWWRAWYFAVHRYPEEIVPVANKLSLLLLKIKEPAKLTAYFNAKSLDEMSRSEAYRKVISKLHFAYNMKTVNLEELIAKLQSVTPMDTTIRGFKIFIAELDSRVDALKAANQDPEVACSSGINQARMHINDSTMNQFEESLRRRGVELSTNVERFDALIGYINVMLVEKETCKIESRQSLSFDFDQQAPSTSNKAAQNPPKQQQKHKNAEGHSNNGNGGKKATDRPDWKNPAESNFSSFEAKKQPRSGTAGDKPLPERDICQFHAVPAKHSPMECRAPMEQRKTMVQKNRICYNCLGKGHMSSKCYSAPGCTSCKQAHHPSLCHKNQKAPTSTDKTSWNGGQSGKTNYPKGNGRNRGGKNKKKVHFSNENKPEGESMNSKDRDWNKANGMVLVSNGQHGASTSAQQDQK
jgi:hypothetical protein